MKHRVTSRALAGVALAAVLLGGASSAFAGMTYEKFSTTVPRLNGSGYTGAQTKAITNAHVQMYNLVVGGPYQVDARAIGTSTATFSGWIRRVNDGQQRYIPNRITKGTGTRIEFSNDLGTLQRVQVEGRWRSQ